MKDYFKEFVDNYKKDPEKVRQIKQSKLERKKNKPKKNIFNFRFWEWMGLMKLLLLAPLSYWQVAIKY